MIEIAQGGYELFVCSKMTKGEPKIIIGFNKLMQPQIVIFGLVLVFCFKNIKRVIIY